MTTKIKVVFSEDFEKALANAAKDLNIEKKELLTAIVENNLVPAMTLKEKNPPSVQAYTPEEHIELIVSMVKDMEASGELQPPSPVVSH